MHAPSLTHSHPHQGEGLILAFHSPVDALHYALAAQEALLGANWPLLLLKVCVWGGGP